MYNLAAKATLLVLLLPSSILLVGVLLAYFTWLIAHQNSRCVNAEGALFIRLLMTHFSPPLALDKTERIFALSILSPHFILWYYLLRILLWFITPHTLKTVTLWGDNLRQGVFAFIASRVILYDEFFLRAIKVYDAKQIIVLGAGFDCRPYRYAAERRTSEGLVTVYEVDLPWVQRDKQERVRKAIEGTKSFLTSLCIGSTVLPDNPQEGVHYVSCDFETQQLGECLIQAGFSALLPTCILLEGVVLYLEPQAVAATLKSISALSASQALKDPEPTTPHTVSTTPGSHTSSSPTPYSDKSEPNIVTLPNQLVDVSTPPNPNAEEQVMHLFFDYFNEEQLGAGAHRQSRQLTTAMAQNRTPFKSGIVPSSIEKYIAQNGGFELVKSYTPKDITARFLPSFCNALVESDWAYLAECSC